MQCQVLEIIAPDFLTKISRPLFLSRVSAGIPSPAENYTEGRMDLNEELIVHQLAAFYIRVTSDSMAPESVGGKRLIVDWMADPLKRDIVARIGRDLCVKRLRIWARTDMERYQSMRFWIQFCRQFR